MTGSWERADGEELDAAGMGGDPPCWAGIVEDHRDEDPDDGVDPVDALPREPHLMSKATDGTSGQVVPKPGDGAVATEQDLSTRTQVDRLVIAFYREIMFDDLLEPVFGEVAEVDWGEHILKLIDYWCWILFGTKGYAGAVTKAHRHLHGLQPIEPEHCDRWFSLWVSCVDDGWVGPYAERAKDHAAVLMAGMARRLFGFTWPAPMAAPMAAPTSASASSAAAP
ncbi:group III truncated hemoglobin [Iamia sp.]|uniref:group III truncated hemoglobin n=1 Tax=Iamia sp. TaxID=2722710 RepID=UPI002B99E635|nr:group III truncated hemoglobin [Iamia sp.]HXH58176.1 group III truncated hemoglobin [Iamia sp.]